MIDENDLQPSVRDAASNLLDVLDKTPNRGGPFVETVAACNALRASLARDLEQQRVLPRIRKRCHVCDTGAWCTEGGFSCPVCESSYFRSSMSEGKIVRRYCKGHYPELKRGHKYTGCTFAWDPQDDAKYGVGKKADV